MVKQGYHHGNLREALIVACLRLIEEKGPTGFTLSEAARVAGVTPAAVYRHFEGREDLIAAAAHQGYEIFADMMEEAYAKGLPSALKAFEGTGRAYLAFARRFEATEASRRCAEAEGLGEKPFSAPEFPNPPEGSPL